MRASYLELRLNPDALFIGLLRVICHAAVLYRDSNGITIKRFASVLSSPNLSSCHVLQVVLVTGQKWILKSRRSNLQWFHLALLW